MLRFFRADVALSDDFPSFSIHATFCCPHFQGRTSSFAAVLLRERVTSLPLSPFPTIPLIVLGLDGADRIALVESMYV